MAAIGPAAWVTSQGVRAETSSKSCDQAVLVYQTSGVSLPSDTVPVEINRFG
jgi:hypothetical protein